MADDEEAKGGDASAKKFALDGSEERDILFDREAADIAEDEHGVVDGPGAILGREQRSIDATLHKMAGSMGGLLEHATELFVRSVEDAGERVEAGGGPEGTIFDAVLEAGGGVLREAAGEPVEAARRILMHVGVPGGGEWNSLLPGEVCAEDAELAGAGDVDEVGLEAKELAADGGGVAEEERIELEILFDADGGAGAAKLEGAELGDVLEGGSAIAGADAEEGELVTLCVGKEVAGGVRYAVDLVEGVGEVSYPWHTHAINVRETDCSLLQRNG